MFFSKNTNSQLVNFIPHRENTKFIEKQKITKTVNKSISMLKSLK